MKVSSSDRLWFDDSSEFVGGVVHSGSMGEIDKSTGRQAVTTV